MKAIIVGGGIGGLTAALCLQRIGWEVSVLEQASAPDDQVGAGIQISPNASHVLRALGVLDTLQKRAFVPEALEMRWGRSGRPIFQIPIREMAEQRWGAPYLHLHRADLVTVLAETLAARAPMALHTGAKVAGYSQNSEGITTQLADGRQMQAELLVGADGIHSLIREQMLGSEKPHFTGNVAWRAVVPMSALGALAPPPTACVWVGPGRHAVSYRLRGGALANFVGVVEQQGWETESWTEAGRREDALLDYAGWHPTVTQLIEKAEAHYRWALHDRKPLPRWSEGRAVLLGDACHPMLPFLAQGAAMAIEDAWVLAEQLQAESDPATAATAYFAARHARTAKVQAGARANTKTFHHPLSVAYGPIWLAARLMPSLLLRRLDWIYGQKLSAAPTPQPACD